MSNQITNLVIPAVLLALVCDHARHDDPLEACGFLLGKIISGQITVHRIIPAPNIAIPEMRTRAYAIDPRLWMRMEKKADALGLAIVGIYHSHPNQSAAISQTDIQSLWPDLVYLIVPGGSQQHQTPTAWTLDENTGHAISCAINMPDQ